MQKNTAGQKVIVFAFDATTNLPKTGDAANITAYVSKDFGSVTVLADSSATEMDATNAKGYYLFDAAQAETNADVLLVSAKSTTSNIVVVGAPATIFTTPPGFTVKTGYSLASTGLDAVIVYTDGAAPNRTINARQALNFVITSAGPTSGVNSSPQTVAGPVIAASGTPAWSVTQTDGLNRATSTITPPA